MAVILEGSALMLECAGCGELYLEGDTPNRRKEGALEAWRERHAACPAVPTTLSVSAPALEQDLADLVKQLAPDLTQVHARTISARILERYELGQIPGRLEAATRMVLELGRQLTQARRKEADPKLLEELERLRAALSAACCIGCGQVLANAELAARHVEACPKHPLGQARARVAAFEKTHEEIEDLVGRILPGIDLAPYALQGQVAMVGDHLDLERAETAKLRRRVAQLEAEACRFYRADGTYEILPPDQVVERRILAARRALASRELARRVRLLRAEVGGQGLKTSTLEALFFVLDLVEVPGAGAVELVPHSPEPPCAACVAIVAGATDGCNNAEERAAFRHAQALRAPIMVVLDEAADLSPSPSTPASPEETP